VKGGHKSNGGALYVGRAEHNGGVFPGSIHTIPTKKIRVDLKI
jgi:hypothetical protein